MPLAFASYADIAITLPLIAAIRLMIRWATFIIYVSRLLIHYFSPLLLHYTLLHIRYYAITLFMLIATYAMSLFYHWVLQGQLLFHAYYTYFHCLRYFSLSDTPFRHCYHTHYYAIITHYFAFAIFFATCHYFHITPPPFATPLPFTCYVIADCHYYTLRHYYLLLATRCIITITIRRARFAKAAITIRYCRCHYTPHTPHAGYGYILLSHYAIFATYFGHWYAIIRWYIEYEDMLLFLLR